MSVQVTVHLEEGVTVAKVYSYPNGERWGHDGYTLYVYDGDGKTIAQFSDYVLVERT